MQTLKTDMANKAELTALLDKSIKDTLEAAVKAKAAELVPVRADVAGRKHELQGQMEWALESILTRVERGMAVEIRFLPPKAVATDGAPTEEVQKFNELRTLAEQLQFPEAQRDPILPLPPPKPPGGMGPGSPEPP
jgi:hypothetical protein